MATVNEQIGRGREVRRRNEVFQFDVVIANYAMVSDANAIEVLDRLYAVKCVDVCISWYNGVESICFTRKAKSLGGAVGSAIKKVEKAGFVVSRVVIRRLDWL